MPAQGLGEMLYPLPADIKTLVRRLERSSFKLCKQKCKKLFNNTCLNENLLPKYTKKKTSTTRVVPLQ